MHGEHPDYEWLRTVSASIHEWLEQPSTSPTSQLTGGGAIERAEQLLSAKYSGRPALLMPSATYALWVALRVFGVRPGDEVLIPQYDWTSSLAVVLALGAKPVVVPVDPNTLTIDPEEAAARRTARTRAAIATHLFGIPADIPALQKALPWVPIIEDCAQAPVGSTLDGHPVGALGDASLFSYGPGKSTDVGELGALVLRNDELRERAVLQSAHPIRQQMSGISTPLLTGLSIRPHPLAAVLLCTALVGNGPREDHADRIRTYEYLALHHWPIRTFGIDDRRENANPFVIFDPDSHTNPNLTNHVTYFEVADVEAIRSGKPKYRRVGAFLATKGLGQSR